jgi:NAD(P)-dependent dehydrogenase (short-subunit alcohol dehydrogenase family)
MSLFDLRGKVAIITGSSKGIGKAIGERMAEHGASVVISSRNQATCETVAGEIRAGGGSALAKACHIGRKEDLRALVDATLAAFGRIDILVCNAAINPYFGPSIDITDEVYDKVVDYNLRSNFWLCNMALPEMVKQGGGSIILISSIAGFQGNDRLGVYAITKAAEMQLARNLAVEWGHHNIRANTIAPGLIQTDFAREIWESEDRLKLAKASTPLNRIGDPDDVAGAAVMLAAAAGKFISGQTLLIDGGRAISGRVGIN